MQKNTCLAIFAFLLAFLFCLPSLEGTNKIGQDADVRKPILAGTWYPGDKSSLQKSVHDYLGSVKAAPPIRGVRAIIVPHAGHIYSGQVAAHAYKLIQNADFDRVIMIGPSHRFGFRGISVNLQSEYRTPLGPVAVDKSLAQKIIDTSPHIHWIPRAHMAEHSLEIQIPFLQTVLKNFKIVPIIMGQQDLGTCTELADTLTKVIGHSERILLLASTDLSHFHGYEQAVNLDSVFMYYVKTNDPQGLAKAVAAGQCEACGSGPVVTVMMTANHLKADQTIVLDYANSGDVTGDHHRVVGYFSAALFRAKDD